MSIGSVLITGAGRGFGLALAEAAHRAGVDLVALVRTEADAARLADRFPRSCTCVVADVSDLPAAADAIASSLSRRGRPLDALVNNAGIAGAGAELTDVDLGQVERLFDVHCLAVLNVTRAALPWLAAGSRRLVANVTSRLGSITNVAAGAYATERHSYAYRIAKASQNMATACLHAELHPRGFTILAVHPGRLNTSLASYTDGGSVAEAAGRMLDLLGRADPTMSGTFRDLTGGVLPW